MWATLEVEVIKKMVRCIDKPIYAYISIYYRVNDPMYHHYGIDSRNMWFSTLPNVQPMPLATRELTPIMLA